MHFGIASVDGSEHFTVTVPIRDGALFSGSPAVSASVDFITYIVSGSRDLSEFDTVIGVEDEAPVGLGLDSLNDGWSYTRFYLSNPELDLPPKGFMRIQIPD